MDTTDNLTLSEPPEPHQLLFAQARSISGEEFGLLDVQLQGQLLGAVASEGARLGQRANGPSGRAEALDCFERAISLGEPRFDSLNDDGKLWVLGALADASIHHRELNVSPTGLIKALDCYERASSLCEPRFASLTAFGKALALRALFNAGVTSGKLDQSPAGRAKALQCYERAAVLGESHFDSMENDGKASVLQSLFNAGRMHRPLDSPTDWAKGIDYYERAAALGEPGFGSLDESGKLSVLGALINAGVMHARLNASPTGWTKTMGYYERAVALVEHQLQVLSGPRRNSAQNALDALESTNYNLGRRPSSALPLSIVLLPWSDSRKVINNVWIRAHTPSRNRSADGPGSDRWLTRARAFPAAVHRPEQSSTVRRLAQARLAIHAQSWHLSALGQPDHQRDRLTSSIAKHIAKAQNLPLECEGLAHWLLALLSVHAPRLVALPSHRHWQDSRWSPDIAAIAQSLRFEAMRLEDGSFRAPYYWATLLAHGELNSTRYVHVPEDSVQASQWMIDWLDRADGKALSEALQLQWLNLVKPIQELAQWLGKQGVEDSLIVASRACLSGQADRAIALALRGDAQTHHSQLNHWLTELAKSYEGRQATEWALAQTLQRFCQGRLSQPGVTPDELWELLESARVGLVGKAHPSKQRFDKWDEEAVKAIHAAELRALDEAERHLQAREAGNPLPMPDQVDGPLEPFTTMAQQWQRMGVGLVFETPASAAALLRPGESLVQLWWAEAEQDYGGAGQALWLRNARNAQGIADFELQHLRLPQQLDRSALEQMLQLWAEQGSLDRLGRQDDMMPLVQATQEVWDSLVAPGSVARQLLAWLDQAGDAQLILILPHELSNLPWQALHEQLQQEQPSTSDAHIQLVPSVSTWAQTRRAYKEVNSASAKIVKASLVMAHDIFSHGGQLQAQRVSQILGINPCVSNDLRDVVQALTHDDVVHLAHHGSYDDEAPQRSALLVQAQSGRAQAQLPAWVLGQLDMHADVSLATCQALQSGVGQGHAAALGPLGIGPMLMAGGARSVAGSLWQCDAWAAAVFFALWYDERRSHDAGTALGRARQRLRTLSYEQLLSWVELVAPDALPQARERCEATRQIWQRPFEHPWCWATFALLGQAPALPTLRSTALPDQTSRTGSKWRAWFVRIWRRFFG